MSLDPDYYKSYINGDDLITDFEKQRMTNDQIRGFLVGNAIKQLVRYDQKNGIEDINKAQTYIERIYQFDVESGLYEDSKSYDLCSLSGFVKGRQLTGYLREKSILNLYKYLENKPDSGDLIRETTVLIGLLAHRFK
mgnify:FL=1